MARDCRAEGEQRDQAGEGLHNKQRIVTVYGLCLLVSLLPRRPARVRQLNDDQDIDWTEKD